MAKSLLDRSMADFEQDIAKMPFDSLKNLIKDIAEKTIGNISTTDLINYIRKETKIWKELQRRGLMPKKEYEAFHKWRFKMYKKRFF